MITLKPIDSSSEANVIHKQKRTVEWLVAILCFTGMVIVVFTNISTTPTDTVLYVGSEELLTAFTDFAVQYHEQNGQWPNSLEELRMAAGSLRSHHPRERTPLDILEELGEPTCGFVADWEELPSLRTKTRRPVALCNEYDFDVITHLTLYGDGTFERQPQVSMGRKPFGDEQKKE